MTSFANNAAATSARANWRRAIEDLRDGSAHWWVWTAMAWQDIVQRYRGSVLGPFWLTISTGFMCLSVGLLYSKVLNQSIASYLPFLCLGMALWGFISTVANEGCVCFLGAEPIIRQIRMPFTTHVNRTVLRNLIVLAHNAVVYVVIAVYFQIPLHPRSLLVLPGLALLTVNGTWMCLLLGMICARFRDFAPIVGTLLQIAFLLTPILWTPAAFAGWEGRWIIDINPLYALIEIVRGPLLGDPVASLHWAVALATTVAGWSLTLWFFARYRARIPYWL